MSKKTRSQWVNVFEDWGESGESQIPLAPDNAESPEHQ